MIRQRSQLWRNWQNFPNSERNALLDAFDTQMALVGTRIHRRRSRALKHLEPLAAAWQERLSNKQEHLKIAYLPGSLLEGKEEEE